jgi:hypothetical protein
MTCEGFAGKPPLDYPADMVFGRGNCGLVGLAVCTGTPLSQVTEWYRQHAKPRGSWKGATKTRHYPAYFAHVGIWVIHTPYPRDRIRTIGDFAEWHCKPDTYYMIRSSGHIMTCRNGWIIDQWANAPANLHRNRNRRVLDSWEVLK